MNRIKAFGIMAAVMDASLYNGFCGSLCPAVLDAEFPYKTLYWAAFEAADSTSATRASPPSFCSSFGRSDSMRSASDTLRMERSGMTSEQACVMYLPRAGKFWLRSMRSSSSLWSCKISIDADSLLPQVLVALLLHPFEAKCCWLPEWRKAGMFLSLVELRLAAVATAPSAPEGAML
jgi:hypothetical protein